MTYVPALGRYLLTVSHSKLEDSAAHKIGIFEGPNPWGPCARYPTSTISSA